MANLNLSEFTEKLFVADADHTFIWDTANAISKRVSRNSWLNSGELTSSAPVTISQTWGTTGTYTALKVVATETLGAASASNLLELWSGNAATLKTRITKDGAIVSADAVSPSATSANFRGSGSTSGLGFNSGNMWYGNSVYFVGSQNNIRISSSHSIGWSTDIFNVANDTILLRDGAANTLALRNGAAAQTFRVYNTFPGNGNNEYGEITWDASTLYFRPAATGTAAIRNTVIGSSGSVTNLDATVITFRPGGASRFVINSGGLFATNDNQVDIGSSGGNRPKDIYLSNRVYFQNGALGTGTSVIVGRSGGSYFQFDAVDGCSLIGVSAPRINFGGTTNLFPAIKRNAAGLQIRLADDSANATLEAGNLYASGNVGIGTTAPGAKLEVVGGSSDILVLKNAAQSVLSVTSAGGAGSIAFSHANSPNLIINQSTGNKITLGVGSNNLHASNSSNVPIDLIIQGAGGNVGIGTTSPTSKLHVAETWNNAGTAFCAIKSVITDTNSAAGSDFLELYSGTSTQPLRMDINKTGQINIYGTWTDASNYERLSFSAPSAANAVIGTNKAGTGTARGLEFQTDGVSRWTIATNGDLLASTDATYNIGAATANRPVNINASSSIRGEYLSMTSGLAGVTRSYLTSPANGVITLTQGTGSDFNRIQFGGTGDAFPAIARDGAGIKFTGAAAGSTAWIKVPPVAVSALPLAATAGAGARAFVNDALAPTFGSAVTGGGAVLVPVYSDGSAWYVG